MEHDVRDVKRGIPQELWRAARAEAVKEGVTVRVWIAEAIRIRLSLCGADVGPLLPEARGTDRLRKMLNPR